MKQEDNSRKIVVNALKGFHASKNPDERLSHLWNISQLIEDTTDDELYELAAAVAVEKDPRLRGEICYAISRSRRPALINFVKSMAQDENHYVRMEAINAIGEINGSVDAIMTVIEPLSESINEIKSAITNIQKEISNIKKRSVGMNNPELKFNPSDGIVIDDRLKSWETYLRNEKELLRDHKGEFVAIYKGEIIGIGPSDVELAKMINDKFGEVSAFIYKIEEENDEIIEIPP
ncbi:MAG: HEAT repeat domain-containing protein, partial [Candidatus Poribacteria bacterium]